MNTVHMANVPTKLCDSSAAHTKSSWHARNVFMLRKKKNKTAPKVLNLFTSFLMLLCAVVWLKINSIALYEFVLMSSLHDCSMFSMATLNYTL